MRQARTYFIQRLDHFAPLLEVQWHKLSLSSAGTRWGSARVDGSIRLNWRLIQMPPDLVDYVVVHELAHLREPNHSPRFWRWVERVPPPAIGFGTASLLNLALLLGPAASKSFIYFQF